MAYGLSEDHREIKSIAKASLVDPEMPEKNGVSTITTMYD